MSVELLLTIIFFGFGLFLPWGLALYWRLRLSGDVLLPGSIGWRPVAHSMLAYVLAFNLTFFLQELFLVLPKALVPGLQPTLYHNNHNWEGDAAIADLFQGTGALAILVSGLIFAVIASRRSKPSFFILWMAFHGLFQSLPQFVVGAITAANDVGQAYDYLGLGPVGRSLARAPCRWPRCRSREFGSAEGSCRRRGSRARSTAARPIRLSAAHGRPSGVGRDPADHPVPRAARVDRSAGAAGPGPAVGLWLAAARSVPSGAIAPIGKATADSLYRCSCGSGSLLAFFQLVLRPGIAF